MQIAEALRHAAARLQAAGVENPVREARLLVAHILGVPARTLLPGASAHIEAAALDRLLARRADAREPLAFITGTRGFWTLDLEVSPATLIPRADSETLIEAAIGAFPDRAGVRTILDLGTGTGCLLLAALSEFHHAWGLGLDRSEDAARLAARNAARTGLAARAAFAVADWAAPLAGRFGLILCNPPYIPSADLAGLMPEVTRHEPRSALDGGERGLRDYARLLPVLPGLLAPYGLACLELGAGQYDDVSALAGQAGFTHMEARTDLGGIARALLLHAPA